MKRFFVLILTALLLLSGCSGAVPADAGRTDDSVPAGSDLTPTQSAELPTDELIPAEDGGIDLDASRSDAYWERLRSQWQNEPEEGWVWTITINDAEVLDVYGLVQAHYYVGLSCSHVGTSMNGVYCGTLGLSYWADLSGLKSMMASIGGMVDGKGRGWFRNDRFTMILQPYDAQAEADFVQQTALPSADGSQTNELLDALGTQPKAFETGTPAGYWYDWDYRMTAGDLDEYATASVNYYGLVDGTSFAYWDGYTLEAEGEADAILGFHAEDSSTKTDYMPFPYIIKVYETGEVTLELLSSASVGFRIRFYGTIDRVLVEDTVVVKDLDTPAEVALSAVEQAELASQQAEESEAAAMFPTTYTDNGTWPDADAWARMGLPALPGDGVEKVQVNPKGFIYPLEAEDGVLLVCRPVSSLFDTVIRALNESGIEGWDLSDSIDKMYVADYTLDGEPMRVTVIENDTGRFSILVEYHPTEE